MTPEIMGGGSGAASVRVRALDGRERLGSPGFESTTAKQCVQEVRRVAAPRPTLLIPSSKPPLECGPTGRGGPDATGNSSGESGSRYGV